MKVMLDTNTCIAIIKRKPPRVLRRFNRYDIGEVGISWVTELCSKVVYDVK